MQENWNFIVNKYNGGLLTHFIRDIISPGKEVKPEKIMNDTLFTNRTYRRATIVYVNQT